VGAEGERGLAAAFLNCGAHAGLCVGSVVVGALILQSAGGNRFTSPVRWVSFSRSAGSRFTGVPNRRHG